MSILHHMAVQRRCWNPREDNDIVGITNYIDFGLQVCSSYNDISVRKTTPYSSIAWLWCSPNGNQLDLKSAGKGPDSMD